MPRPSANDIASIATATRCSSCRIRAPAEPQEVRADAREVQCSEFSQAMPQVFIPPAMRPLVAGQAVVEAAGGTVREVIDDLERRYPGIKDRLSQDGTLRPGLAVAVGGSTSALGLLQRVKPDDEVHFLPMIGGG